MHMYLVLVEYLYIYILQILCSYNYTKYFINTLLSIDVIDSNNQYDVNNVISATLF